MKFLYFLLKINRGTIILAILVGIVSGVSGASLITIINSALHAGGAPTAGLVYGFAGIGLLVLASNVVSQQLSIRISQGAIVRLRLNLCRQILAANLRHLEEVGTPRLMAALTEDAPVITNAILRMPSLCINSAITLACLVYLGWLSPLVLGAVIAFMVPGVVVYQSLTRRGLKHLRAAREEADLLFKHFRAMTEGAKELKLHASRRDVFFSQHLEEAATAVRGHNIRGLSLYNFADNWSLLLFYIFVGLLLFVLPTFAHIGAHAQTGYTLTVFYIMGPLGIILSVIPSLSRADVALKKVESLGLSLETHGAEAGAATARPAPCFSALELSGVTHTYRREGDDRNFTLGPVSLSLSPGEVVFLVGGNGSGKTTLAKLLTGLYVPEGGEIRLNGTAVTAETREAYRQHFSVVFSDFFLFENLLGLENESLDAEAREYLSQLRLDGNVKVEDGKLSTTALSQGQRKRLALLTALLEDRPFYVFDEWAADQDPVFKEVFYTQFLARLKERGKSVLVISHDDRYYHLADRLVKLDYGQLAVAQCPTPDEYELDEALVAA